MADERWQSRSQHLHWIAAGDQLPDWTPIVVLDLWPSRLLHRVVCWRYGHDLDTDHNWTTGQNVTFCIWCQHIAPNEDVPLLACGHPDNDPTVYHNNPDQQPVCAACCHECGDTA